MRKGFDAMTCEMLIGTLIFVGSGFAMFLIPLNILFTRKERKTPSLKKIERQQKRAFKEEKRAFKEEKRAQAKKNHCRKKQSGEKTPQKWRRPVFCFLKKEKRSLLQEQMNDVDKTSASWTEFNAEMDDEDVTEIIKQNQTGEDDAYRRKIAGQ